MSSAEQLGGAPRARPGPAGRALEAHVDDPASASLSRWKAATERATPSASAASSRLSHPSRSDSSRYRSRRRGWSRTAIPLIR